MYSIYFDNKVIIFTTADAPQSGIEVACGEKIDTTKVLQKVDNSKTVVIKADDPRRVFDDFCSFFIFVEAAGGLVTAPDGSVLMIFRNGRWDLPKGHLECGETMAECAVRELEEECSVSDLECGDLITTTLHCYNIYGRWELKQTHWYAMSCNEKQPLKPQTEEGITEARWVAPDALKQYLRNSYMTIQQVFTKAKIK